MLDKIIPLSAILIFICLFLFFLTGIITDVFDFRYKYRDIICGILLIMIGFFTFTMLMSVFYTVWTE